MDCGSCVACENDDLAGNDSNGNASFLGSYTDNSNTKDTVTGLVLTPGEQDWFSLGAEDACCLGNPKPGVAIHAGVATADIVVLMAYECANASTATYECLGGVFDDALSACVMNVAAGSTESWMQLDKLNCSGTNETGTAMIQVTSVSSTCQSYDLTFEVSK